MDKEIKEILEELKRRNELFNNLEGDVEISPIEYYEAHLLLDYITNLQQENESLRTRIKTIKRLRRKQTQKKNKYKALIFNEEKALHNYKSRCEKASEDIKFCLHSIKQEYEMSIDERTRNEMESCVQIFNKTLNILQNGSDSQ